MQKFPRMYSGGGVNHGLSKKEAGKLVSQDVETVCRRAQLIIDLSSDNSGSGFIFPRENPKGKLMVIAIIGPGTGLPGTPIEGKSFERALLAEIGISRAKPYRTSHTPRRNLSRQGERTLWRRKWFLLSKSQYLRVAPSLFTCIQILANERIRSWKHQSFVMKTQIALWKSRSNRVIVNMVKSEIERGCCFAFDYRDAMMLADLFATEFKHEATKRQIKGLSNCIGKCLSPYRSFTQSFWRLKAAKNIRRQLRITGLPHYLQVEAARQLPLMTRQRFQPYLQEILDWDGGPTVQSEYVAGALPNLWSRTRNMRTRIVSQKPNYVTFEVFAKDISQHLEEPAIA